MPSTKMFEEITDLIRGIYGKPTGFIGLHEPKFVGNERAYVVNAIDSTFVSSVGEYVNQFEKALASYVSAKYAVATSNGTSALHLALVSCGVESGDEVLTQALTFIATANAITYVGATPYFIDVDYDTMGMSPDALEAFIEQHVIVKNGQAFNKTSGKRISACVPMHTFGHPARIDRLLEVCERSNIVLIEDAAESLGSYHKGKHTGTFGRCGAFSFNGNKIITCGGGGAIVTDNAELAARAKHLSTQAKKPHRWDFDHDHIGYNYRMPNINAALACAQLEKLEEFLENKRTVAKKYAEFFSKREVKFKQEPIGTRSNYWLNAIEFGSREQRDSFLGFSNDNQVMTRPIWNLMSELLMFKNCGRDALTNSKLLANVVVNIPSSVT